MKRKRGQNILFKTFGLLAISLFLTGNTQYLSAQEGSEQIAIGESIGFGSNILGEKRNIYIYCPPDYAKEKKAYPALYLLDAEYQFHYVTGVIAFLSEIAHIPGMLVVGITNADRNRDLTPEPGEAQKKRFPTAGGAERFLNFLQIELIPYIESRYRVEPFRVLAGWSLGGLFSIHAMLNRPDTFNAYIAMSPSLYWNNQAEIAKAEEVLGALATFNKTLFMTMGNERQEMVDSAKRFSEAMVEFAPPDFNWKYEPMPEETHASIKLKSFYEGIEFIFSDLRLTDNMRDIRFKEYHQKLLRKYGYNIPLSSGFLQGAYNTFWEKKRFEDAVDVVEYIAREHSEAFPRLSIQFVQAGQVLMKNELYECAIRLYESIAGANDKIFDVYKNLGDAYLAVGITESALQNYKKAQKLRPDDPYTEGQINTLTKKTAGGSVASSSGAGLSTKNPMSH